MSIYEKFSQQELQTLKLRADRIASKTRGDDADAQVSALLVSVAGETYALPIADIALVYEGARVEPIPCVPRFVAGVANVRGHILPVINLSALLGTGSTIDEDATRLIVAGNDEMSIALYVDGIGEVEALPLNRLAPIPATFHLDRTHHLQGVLPDGVILLDVQAILNDPALVVDEQPQ
jgi:purine-binding chemotaxis protein CheW